MLIEQLALEVVMVDERLTSRMAEQVMLEADLSRKNVKRKLTNLLPNYSPKLFGFHKKNKKKGRNLLWLKTII